MEYNQSQDKAINSKRRKLLVSAGAGSGKTRVLVGRVLRLVAVERYNLSQLLIITFTRAAAAELRTRILSGIAALAAEEPTNVHLRRQLTSTLDGVCTIDAFYSKLVREFSHTLGVGEFRVIEGAERDIIKEQAKREALERILASDDADLRAFIGMVPLQAAERIIMTAVERLYEAEQSHPFPEQWRRESLALYDGGDFAASKYGVYMSEVDKLTHYLDEADTMQTELRAQLPALRGLYKAVDVFAELFRAYKMQRGALDFADMNRLVVRLLCRRVEGGGYEPTDEADIIGARYAEIFIDEFQDTNRVQTLVAELLTKSLFMVGDVKQSIYRFRQAEPSIFLERRRDYPTLCNTTPDGADAKVALAENYRSRPEVVDTVNYFFGRLFYGGASEIEYTADERQRVGRTVDRDARYNTEFAILLLPPKSKEEADDAVAVEAAYTARRIQELLQSGLEIPDGDTTRPVRAGDIAILLRSAGESAWVYESALRLRGIEAHSGGSAGLTSELAAVLSLLSVIDNPYHDIPLIGALRSPMFGFSPDELAAIRAHRRSCFFHNLTAHAESDDHAALFLDTIDDFRNAALRMPLDRLLLYIYEKTGAPALYSALPSGAGRRALLDVLYHHARRYAASPAATLRGFCEYATTLIETGKFAESAPTSGDAVKIMTVHKSKGLEFPIVFLCGLGKQFNLRDTYADVLIHPTFGVGMKCYDAERRVRYPSGAWLAISEKLKAETYAEELRILYVAMTRAREKLFMSCAIKKLERIAEPEVIDDAFLRAAFYEADWLLPILRRHPSAADLRAKTGAVCVDINAEGSIDIVIADVTAEDAVLPLIPPLVQAGQGVAEVSDIDIALAAAAFEWRYAAPALANTPTKLTATAVKGLRPIDTEDDEGWGGGTLYESQSDSYSSGSAAAGEPQRGGSPADGAAAIGAGHSAAAAEGGDAAERGADVPPPRVLPPPRRPRFVTASLTPAERGSALHAALQYADFAACADEASARREVARLLEARFLTARQAEAASAEADKIAAFAQSPLCTRAMSAERTHREFRFSLLDPASRYFSGLPDDETVMLQGVVDMFFVEDNALVVVDFKSDRVTKAAQAARAGEYATQLDAYARALSRIFGLPVKERLVYFMQTGEAVSVSPNVL